jgi:PAS domain S-box-containing protein
VRVTRFAFSHRAALAAAALLAVIAGIGPIFAQPLREDFVSVAYGVDDGVPQPIEDVLQTPDGYIWAATQGGLARFDGLRFKLYRVSNTPGLLSNSLNALAVDRAGALWIGTGKGLVRYADGRFETIGLAKEIVSTLAIDADGLLWVGATNGVYRREPDGRLNRLAEVPLPAGARLWRLSADREGRIWIASPTLPLQVYEHGKFRAFTVGGQSVPEPVSVAETSDGTLWIATDTKGVYRIHGDTMEHIGADRGFGVAVTVRSFADQHDRVWVGGYGVWLCEPNSGGRFARVLPQLKEHVRAMAEDREGNIWLGTIADGLVRVRGTGFELYNRERGLPARIVKNVAEDRSGNLWVSVERESPVRIAPDGTIRQFQVDEGYGTDIRSLAAGPDGSRWFGYRDFLQVWRDGRAENYPQYPSLRALFCDRTGAMWIGRDNGPVLRWRQGEFETIGGKNGVPGAVAVAFAEGPHGEIYIGYARDGLAKIADGKVTTYRVANGLPDDELRAIYPDREGNVWIGTKSRGFAVLINGKWLNPDAFVDLAQDSVAAILEDDDGQLFFGTGKGVVTARKADVLAMAQGGPPARFQSLLVADGVGSSSVWSAFQPVACKSHNGTLWFATRQGLMGINPHAIPVNREPPPVQIQRVLADDAELTPEQNRVTVAAGAHTLVFEYAALSFSRPRLVRFKYMLEGYDRTWIDGGTQREARYVRLPPHEYRFHVIAANEDGVWNETGAALTVVRLPHFYQTWWFYGAIGFLGVASVVGTHRWRTRALRQDKARLEAAVAERTAEVARSYETLRASEYFYHSLVESLPQVIARRDMAGRYTYVNTAFCTLLGRPPEAIIGRGDRELRPEHAAKHVGEDERVIASRVPIEYEEVIELPGQPKRHYHVKKVPLIDDREQPIGVQVLAWDLSSVRETEEKLRVAQRELLETSRLAGIAEMATGVLHNIGNALNSLTVSASVLVSRARQSKAGGIERLARLLPAERDALLAFYAQDPRALLLPRYLSELATVLQKESQDIGNELEALRGSVNHINDIVADQQSVARVDSVAEPVSAEDLVEFALRMTDASLARHGITIRREFIDRPTLTVARQKVLQILVNLVRNATEALDTCERPERRLIVRIRLVGAERVRFELEDNGPGIPPQNLTKIFAFGFTTKKTGHGFGLHNSALAAREMGGSLKATSEGAGLGALFILELPLVPPPSVTVAE